MLSEDENESTAPLTYYVYTYVRMSNNEEWMKQDRKKIPIGSLLQNTCTHEMHVLYSLACCR